MRETFHSLNELTENFDLDRFGLFVSKNEHQVTFFSVDVQNNPIINYSLKLHSNLSYEMWIKGQYIKDRFFKNDLPK